MGTENLLLQSKEWFAARKMREKILVTGLSFSVIYAIFALAFFHPIDNRDADLTKELSTLSDQSANLQMQLEYIKALPSSPVYKDLLEEHKSYQELKNKYKSLLNKSGSAKWDEIIRAILNNYPNITIEKISNSPESIFETTKLQNEVNTIYQQKIQLVVLGNFQDVAAYIMSLESAMPNIHWESLDYKVTEYPLANVEMEFAILYEKSK